MATIYARVSEESCDYVKCQAERSGASIARVIEELIREARRQGWQFSSLAIVSDKPE